ncbi:hypothetical protein COHA_004366 [Chlorella ohadii]|uniref:Uncharacterized protein n=1 Tax=Chlorella ohadii TaxID=2649997 RepID=A0AAD5H771_9CHLO|nr:hypothetical protein COHA_004366 [Chlorella ohadii]
MYIMQQSGEACCVKKVGTLCFPQLLCDSLAGARILRGVAALLHMEFCKPPKLVMAKRLKQCFQMLIPSSLRRMLVADCRAYACRRHADVDKRGVEDYLYKVVCPMLARR